MGPFQFQDPVVKMFFEAQIDPIISALDRKEFCFPEIQAMHDGLVNQTKKRYGTCIQLGLNEAPLGASRGFLGSTIARGTPHIIISIAGWMHLFYGDFHQDPELLETTFVCAFLHELIHLAYGLSAIGEEKLDRERMYECERIVWAKTCEDVIRLFVARNRELSPNENMFYDAWGKCGRNQLSRWWKDFIENHYKDVNSEFVL